MARGRSGSKDLNTRKPRNKDQEEKEMLARWDIEFGTSETTDVQFTFPASVLSFNVFFDDDQTVVFGAVPTEYFELTGHMYDQSFLIDGLDEEAWFETKEGYWETELLESLDEAAQELEELGMTRNLRIANPFEDEDEDEDDADDDAGDPDGAADDDVELAD